MALENNRSTSNLTFDYDESIDPETIDKLLNEAQRESCLKNDDSKQKKVCKKNLELLITDSFGKVGLESRDFFNHLKKNVFSPLALDVKEETTFSGLIR